MAIISIHQLRQHLDAVRNRRALPDDRRRELAEHYAGILEKYGYRREVGNADAFDWLADYFGQWWAGKNGDADYPAAGFMLAGKNGVGKSAALRIFSALFEIEYVTATDVAINFQAMKPEAFWQWIESMQGAPLILDDIANEGTARVYGNAIPFATILDRRYSAFEYSGHPTFFASNIDDSGALRNLYGDAARSRIFAMVGANFVKIGGVDHRIAQREAKA